MTVRTYSSPKAFKEAMEQRLRSASKNGVEFARRRQLLVFDRFLARVVAVLKDTVLLKGGLVLELRLSVRFSLTTTREGEPVEQLTKHGSSASTINFLCGMSAESEPPADSTSAQ